MSKIAPKINPFEPPVENCEIGVEKNQKRSIGPVTVLLECLFFSLIGSTFSFFGFVITFLLGVVILNEIDLPFTKLENFGQFGFLLVPIGVIGALTGMSCFLVPLKLKLRLWFLIYLVTALLLFACFFKTVFVELPDVVLYSLGFTCFLTAVALALPMQLLKQFAKADRNRKMEQRETKRDRSAL